ncbi:MAG: Holliday junction branch migration protein RuvA [Zhaonellaceae bacterium]|nr:Holliday junction branch migration protein RuvA [Clostridia bacterium]
MFAFIKGIIECNNSKTVVINVHGVGYEINIPSNIVNQLPKVGNSIQLFTYFYLREDQAQLFGFLNSSDKELFKILLEVSGVGPKLALEILSNCSPANFISAIMVENIDFLVKIPGVGKKTAQRLIIELKDKLKKLGLAKPSISEQTNQNQSYFETVEALMALGYKQSEIEQALQKVANLESASTDSLIRAALLELGRE